MFVYVICYLKVVFHYRALELYHHCSSGDCFTALLCMVEANVPICAHLAPPLGGRALMALGSLLPFDPVLLSLLPIGC